MQLIDYESGKILLAHVETASTIWQRFRGLMFRRNFSDGYGLWLEHCGSVHTMWMRVTIDIYFISKDGTVQEHRPQVTPWSFVLPAQRAHSVLEIPNATSVLEIGTRVRLKNPMEGSLEDSMQPQTIETP